MNISEILPVSPPIGFVPPYAGGSPIPGNPGIAPPVFVILPMPEGWVAPKNEPVGSGYTLQP